MYIHVYIGIKTGYSLTQTCILIAALWGILYFKEIDIRLVMANYYYNLEYYNNFLKYNSSIKLKYLLLHIYA
jgi:hypothetical protein